MLTTKLSKLKTAYAAGDIKKAMAIAARFPELGDHAADITRAHECLSNPSHLHEQMGKDRNALIEAGIAALRTRYDLGAPGGFDAGKADADETALDRKAIDLMAAQIAGTPLGRSATKAKAIARLRMYADQNGLDHIVREALGAANEGAALKILHPAIDALNASNPVQPEETDMPKKPAKTKAAKPAKAPKAEKIAAKAPAEPQDGGDTGQPHLTTEELRNGFTRPGKGSPYTISARGYEYEAEKQGAEWIVKINGTLCGANETFTKAVRAAEAAFKA